MNDLAHASSDEQGSMPYPKHCNTRLANLWLDALAAECGAAASTLATYRDDLRCYLTFLQARRRTLPEVTLEDARAYIADISQRSYAEATLAHRRSVVRTLHRFLVAEGFSLQDPTRDVAPMKRSSPLPYTPTAEQVDRLLEAAHAQAADPPLDCTGRPAMLGGLPCSRSSMPQACGSVRP